MKKLIYLFIGIITLLSFSSCEKEDVTPDDSNSTSISFTATDDAATVSPLSNIDVDVITNDGITAENVSYITIESSPSIGTVSINKEYVVGCGHCGAFTGEINYDAANWYPGAGDSDSFIYKVTLVNGESYTATVNITIQ